MRIARPGTDRSRPYHRPVPTPALLAIALVMFVLLLAPTRRLQAAGWPPRALGGYMLGMLLIGLSFAVLPISGRVLVPILVVGFLAPFVTARNGLDRFRRGGRAQVAVERRPVKAVSGPARDVPPVTRPADREAAAEQGRDEAQASPPAMDAARPAPSPGRGPHDPDDADDPGSPDAPAPATSVGPDVHRGDRG